MIPVATVACYAAAPPPEPPGQLIREVVYNELRDHNSHGYWRYWVRNHVESDTRLEEEVETAEGPIKKLVETNGRPLDPQTTQAEQMRLARLVNSPALEAIHRRAYIEDEKHIGLILKMLPDAFLFQYVGEEDGRYHLRYQPNPSYSARTIETHIIHAMSGDVWIDAQAKRLSRLEGHLVDNVDFGFGLIGRLDRGGWFRMRRIPVSPTEWKTDQLEIHMSGHAVVFKSIDKETSEVLGGFASVPSGMDLAQGVKILEQTAVAPPPADAAHVAPVSLSRR
jgi:hypothetical protein